MDVDQLELDELRDLVQTLRAELGGFRQEQLTMVQQEKELKEGVLELQNYLKSHPALAASPVLPPSSPPASTPLYTHILPNPPMPQKFGGNSRDYMNFLTQCKLHFLNRPDVYNTDSSKVLFVLMNLEGNAQRWANPFINQDHRMLRDYDLFSRMFTKMFECKREKEIKQNELIEYRQGRRETQEYVTHFQMLASSTDWPDSVLIKLFYKGLREDVKDMLSNMLTLPTVFSEYTTLTIQIDQRLHERKKEKQEPTFQRGKQEPVVNLHMPQPMKEQVNLDYTDVEEPMQIGQISKTQCPSENERRRLENLCFYCGDNQHLISQCPIRPQKMANPVRTRIVPAVRSSQEELRKPIRVIEKGTHLGVTCDACLASDFQGKRYKCLACPDYDLCEDCYTRGTMTQNHTKAHKMRCILRSAPKAKAAAVRSSPVSQEWVTIEEDSGSDTEFDTPLHLRPVNESPKPRHISVVRSQADSSVSVPQVCQDKGFLSDPTPAAESSLLHPIIPTYVDRNHIRPIGPIVKASITRFLYVTEKERRRVEHLCYYCGDARHFLVLCPHRPPRQYDPIVTAVKAKSTIQASLTIDSDIANTMFTEPSLEAITPAATSPAIVIEAELPTCNATPTTELDPDLLQVNAVQDDEDSEWEDIPTQKRVKQNRKYWNPSYIVSSP